MSHRFKTLIVEDKEKDLKSLLECLEKHTDVFEISAIARTFNEAVKILSVKDFELSILDNRLDNGKDFIDLLQTIERTKFGIIAATSDVVEELPVKGLKVRFPLSLPKPHVDEVITLFIARLFEEWKAIDKACNKRFPATDLLGVATAIPFDKIFFFEADKKYTKVYFDTSSIDKPNSYSIIKHDGGIGDVLEKLDDNSMFFKSQKSYVVNINRIKKCRYSETDKRNAEILFRDVDKFSSGDTEVIAYASKEGIAILKRLNFLK